MSQISAEAAGPSEDDEPSLDRMALPERGKPRAKRRKSSKDDPVRLSYGALVVNTDEHAVYENGARVHLTKKEYEILFILLANRGKVMTKEAIFTAVWGDRVHLEEGVLAVHVKAIRNKLEGRYIENVRGIGYLVPREAPA